jgi:hypothetical protein
MSERYGPCKTCQGVGTLNKQDCGGCEGTGFSGDALDLTERSRFRPRGSELGSVTMGDVVSAFIKKLEHKKPKEEKKEFKQMNLEKLKDPFKEDEVEFRVGQSGEDRNGKPWVMVLAYISARAILDRLDEVVGPGNWKVSYDFPSATGVICNLSIKIGDEWVTKCDGAEQTDIESFKGGISSALKRAGSAWGIGRYLYSLESSFAQVHENKVEGSQYGKTKSGKVFYWTPPKLPAWAIAPTQKPSPGPNPNLGGDSSKSKVVALWKNARGSNEGLVALINQKWPFHQKNNVPLSAEQWSEIEVYIKSQLQANRPVDPVAGNG